ncbi:6-phosphogluconate dehydrogenase-like, C-terminal domain superfamily [Sesbania bispinosa]|nr:6-phosphogluconate dehydrogenase-like, C-terminal domain superfamily [Sesbania bispinosa]
MSTPLSLLATSAPGTRNSPSYPLLQDSESDHNGANLVGISEGLVFTKRAGLDLERFVDAIRNDAAGSKALELFGERMIQRDFRPGGFAEYQVKDLGMGVDVVKGGDDDIVVVLPGASLWNIKIKFSRE